jgi:Cof subfamily protein (haloacid dehalogenase superfamily)
MVLPLHLRDSSLPHVRPQLVASDLDGTLLASDLVPRAAEARGVEALRASGVRFVVCTGRMFQSTRRVLAEFGVTQGTCVCYQGAFAGDLATGDRLISRPIASELAAEVVVHARALRRHLNAFIDDQLHLEELDHWARLYMERGGVDCILDQDLKTAVLAAAPDKLLLLTEPEDALTLAPALAERWRGRLYVAISQPGYVEITDPSATKRAALDELARRWGVQRERTVACGDSFNDIDMLEWAGYGVAMAEGPPQVCEAADVVLPRDELGRLFERLAALPEGE